MSKIFDRTGMYWLFGAIVLILVTAACSSGGDDTASQTATGSAAQPQSPAAAVAPSGSTGSASSPIQAVAPAPATGVSAPSATEPAVNRVVMALQLETEANDPRYQTTIPSGIGMRPMHENLIGHDATTGAMVPGLATEWTLEAGPSYRFKLREDVQFHKGWGEMTAEDVLFSFQNSTHPESTSSGAVSLLELVKEVEIVNDHEVVIHLTETDPTFLVNDARAWEVISKAHSDALGGKAPNLSDEAIAGTAPYQFKERSQGSFIRYERVPYTHWRMTPDFPEFEFRILREESTRLAALLAGEVHLAEIAPDLHGVAESEGMRVIPTQKAGLRIFAVFQCCYFRDGAYTHQESPLLNDNVRKALNKAINRDELNTAFFRDKGDTMYNAHVYPTDAHFNPQWETRFPEEYGYDPAAARAILTSEGYGPGNQLETILTYSQRFAGSEDVGDAIMGFWREIGVDVEGLTIDARQQRTLRRNGDFENNTYVINTSSNIFTAMGAYHSPSSAKIGFETERTTAIYNEVLVTMDQGRLNTLFREWGDIVYDRHLDIPLFLMRAELVVDPNVVADYVYPGDISGSWTHVENIKSAR